MRIVSEMKYANIWTRHFHCALTSWSQNVTHIKFVMNYQSAQLTFGVFTQLSVAFVKGKYNEIEYKQKKEENSRRSKASGAWRRAS